VKASLFLSLATLALFAACPAARAQSDDEAGQHVAACLQAASAAAHVPRGVLLVLLYVEGGRPGTVSPNSNGTADLGPMQVNTSWVGKIATHWRSTPDRTYAALRDNACANIEAGSWILGQALNEARGDLWQAVAYYHSRTPRYGEAYLRRFYDISQAMMTRARQEQPS